MADRKKGSYLDAHRKEVITYSPDWVLQRVNKLMM